MVLGEYAKLRIVHYHSLGLKLTAITHVLAREDGIVVNRSSVYHFVKKFQETGYIDRKLGSGRPTKIMPEILSIVEQQMQLDYETTAMQLQKVLVDSGHPKAFFVPHEAWMDISMQCLLPTYSSQTSRSA